MDDAAPGIRLVRDAASEARTAKRRPMLSVAQIAEFLNVSTRQVLRYINEGDLVAYDMRGRRSSRPEWRVKPGDFDAFEASRFGGRK